MRFLRSAGKHGVPRRSAWVVTMKYFPREIVTNRGESGWLFVGVDDRGVEIEVVTVMRGREEWVIHSMPTSFRHV